VTDTLLYLAYGADVFAAEASYSLLSAFAWAPPDAGDVRYLVYTDRPAAFADLGVEVVALDAAAKAGWLGEGGYNHRIKMSVHRDALARRGGRVVFMDTDTCFLRDPRRLFARVGPARTVLHVAEGRLGEIDTADFVALRDIAATGGLHDLDRRPLTIGPGEMMWNSGVVGLDAADAWLLDGAIDLVDQLRRIPASHCAHQIDQFATGAYFARHSAIREAVDLVFHYWFHDVKAAFRARLPDLLARSRRASLRDWGRAALAERPRTSPLRRAKMHARTALRGAGLRVPGLRASP
jgi:hypothetical protein